MQFKSPTTKFRERFGGQVVAGSSDNDGTGSLAATFLKGPFDATLCKSFDEVLKKFGDYDDSVTGLFAAKRFFDAAGRGAELVIKRIAHYTDITDASTLTAVKATYTLDDIGPGYSLSGAAPAIVTSGSSNSLAVNLSGDGAQEITVANGLSSGAAIAAAMQAEIRDLTANTPANQDDFENCIVIFDTDGRYVIFNGTPGAAKTVVVTNAVANNMADELKLGVANGGTEVGGFVPQVRIDAASEGTWGNDLSVTTEHSNKVQTVLTANLLNGATELQVERLAGIVPGQYLEIEDNTAPLNDNIVVTVDRIQNGRVLLTEAVVLAETVEAGATPATVRSLEWDLIVLENGFEEERFTYLAMNPDNTTDYFETKINGLSSRITATDLENRTRPAYEHPGEVTDQPLTGGDNGLDGLVDDDFVGDVDARTGMQGLRDVKGINFFAVAEWPTAAVHQAMLDLAKPVEQGGVDKFSVVLDPPQGLDENEIVEYVVDTARLASDRAIIAYPNLKFPDPRNRERTYTAGASASLMGLRAKMANTPGVGIGRPPGGMDHPIDGVVGLENLNVLQESVRDVIYPARINPLINLGPNTGIFLFGVQTLLPGGTGGTGEWQQRDVVYKIKREIEANIIQPKLISGIVDEELLSHFNGQVTLYLRSIRQQGFLVGVRDEDAFLVDFTLALNPFEEMQKGIVRGKLFVRLPKALEFVEIELGPYSPNPADQFTTI